jgi:hypothetical protein
MNVIAAGAAITENGLPYAAAEATKAAAPEATEAATAASRGIAGIKCGLAAACAGRRSRPDQPAPIRAFALGVCCGILADLGAQPRHELLDDRTFGRAQSDEHEIRPPAEHRFVAKRCDQLTLAGDGGHCAGCAQSRPRCRRSPPGPPGRNARNAAYLPASGRRASSPRATAPSRTTVRGS